MTGSAIAATIGVVGFPLAMVYAGVMDFLTLKIRNVVVLGIAACWLILAPLAGFSFAEIGTSLAVAALVFILTFAFFAMGWIGGGDAKLAAVTALWFAPEQALSFFLIASILGGVLSLAILRFRSVALPAQVNRLPWLARLRDANAGVPYGAAMAPAALIVFPQTAWLLHAVN